MDDTCETCSHGWHGLPCENKNTRVNGEYRYEVTEKCKCTGPFGLPNRDGTDTTA